MKRPTLIPIVFFLSGIFIAGSSNFLPNPTFLYTIIALLITTLISLTIFLKRRRLFLALLLVFFFILGIFRYMSVIDPESSGIKSHITGVEEKVIVHGTVLDYPEKKGYGYSEYVTFPVKARKLLIADKELNAKSKVQVRLFNSHKVPDVGDEIAIEGKASLPKGKSNPSGFDYSLYLKRMGIEALMYSKGDDAYLKTGETKSSTLLVRKWIGWLREKTNRTIKNNLVGTPKAIVEAVILGRRTGIHPGIEETFARTGTMHILAVSGLHIGIVGAVMLAFLKGIRLPARGAYVITIICICVFAVFTGARPSAMRAALMGSFLLAGLALGRKTDLTGSLALSAFIITFFAPSQLFMPGFMLSYLAVLSIIFITPLVDPIFGLNREKVDKGRGKGKGMILRGYILQSFSVSLAVCLGMMPVIARYFHIVTPISLVMNLIAVPVLFVVIIMSFCIILTGAFSMLVPVTSLFAGGIAVLIEIFIKLAKTISCLPGSFFRVASPGGPAIVMFYVVLAGSVMLFHKRNKKVIVSVLFLIFAVNFFIWNEIFFNPEGSIKITFFDTGKSDASIIEFPDRSVMMIDGGSGGGGRGFDHGREILAPYLWQNRINKIDCIVLTHLHEDHMGGLMYIMRNFSVGTVLESGVSNVGYQETFLYENFKDIIEQKKTGHEIISAGDIIDGFNGAKFFVLNPTEDMTSNDPNTDSIVMKALTDKGNSVIFCADAGAPAMENMFLFGEMLKSDIMKMPHHGGNTGDMKTVEIFLDNVAPDEVVITNRSRRKLNKGLIEILENSGANVHITGEDGAVIVRDEEGGFEVETMLE